MRGTQVAAVLPKPAPRDEEGIILPRNAEAERSTLGAALLHVDAADYICDHLVAGDYFRRAHQVIFSAIVAIRETKGASDLVTIKEELSRKGVLEDVGGPAYIAALVDGVPRSANIEHYAAILKDLAAKRALVHDANRTLDLIAAGAHSSAALLVDADRRLMDLQAGHTHGRMRSVKDATSALLDDLEWRHAHKGELTGVDTGFKGINDLTGGWQAGDLVVIGARPSIGKSSFAINSAIAAARTGKRVAVFSLEMRRKQLEYRILSQLSAVPLSRVLSGYSSAADYGQIGTALGAMSELHIDIDDRSGQTAWDVRGACRRLKAEGGLDLVVIDYVQLMTGTLERRGSSRNEEITDISRRTKILADELGVPILMLSQLSRGNEKRSDPRPKLSDLRESGALEQDADIVGFLHRRNHREGGTTSFILEKQRNGPCGTVNLTLDRDIVTFTDGGEDEPPPEPEPPRTPRQRSFADRYRGARA